MKTMFFAVGKTDARSGGLGMAAVSIASAMLLSGAAAMARVFYDEVKLNTSPPRMGRVTGNLNDAVYRFYAKDQSSDVEKVYHVSWNKSKAPHGHLLEDGTSRMPAKPFMRPAFDRAPEAIRAGNDRMAERFAEGPNLQVLE